MKFCLAIRPLLLVVVLTLPASAQLLSISSAPVGFCPVGKDVPVGDVTLQVNSSNTTKSGSYLLVTTEFPLGASAAPTLVMTPGPIANVVLSASGQSIFIRFNAAVPLTPSNSFRITGLTADATMISGTKAIADVEASVGSTFTFSSSSTVVGNADSTTCPAMLVASSTALTFRAPPGPGIVVPSQMVTLTSANGQNFATPVATVSTDTGGSWLSAAVGGSNNSYTISVSVDASALVIGKYTGKVSLAVTNTTNSPVVLNVTLFVYDGPLLPSTTSMSFRTSVGLNPPPQQLVLRTSDPAVPLPSMSIVVQTPSGGSWLTATAVSGTDSSGAILTVTVSPKTGSLPASGALAYTGLLVFTADTAQPPVQNVIVQLQVDAQLPQIALSKPQVGFSATVGATTSTPATQTVVVSNTGGGTLVWAAAATTTPSGTWLSVTPTSGTGSGSVTITANPTGLAAGIYTGTVTVSSTGATNTPQQTTVILAIGTVPIAPSTQAVPFCPTLTDAAMGNLSLNTITGGSVTAGATLQVNLPAPLSATAAPTLTSTPNVPNIALTVTGQVMTLQFGGAVALPDNTTLTITGLRLDASKISTTQATATVSVPAGSPFTLAATSVVIGNADATVCPPRITLSPTQLSFTVAAGSTSASSQTFLVGNVGGGTFNWSAVAATDNGGPWLSINPTSGTGNVVVTASVNPSGLAPGAYTGAVSISSSTATNSPQKVAVTLTVGNVPTIADQGIKNGASFSSGGASAGSILSVFGSNLASSTDTARTLPLPTLLAGAQVKVNGSLSPLFYASPGQINFMLPSETTGGSANIVVNRDGSDGAPTSVTLSAAVPGLFSQTSDGKGPGAILKADFSLVTASNPAAIGSVVLIYGTGMGPVTPAIPSGQPAPTDPTSKMTLTPQVTIGGQLATVSFAGLAPGFAGLYQLNVQIPTGISTGTAVPVVVSIGGAVSNQVTIAVQ